MKLTTLFAVSVSLILSGFCSLGVQAHPVLENSSGDPVPAGAYYTDNYRNLFNEYLGISQQQTDRKMEQIWNHFFVNEKQRFTMRVMTILPIFMIQGIRMCVQKECPME